MVPVNSHIHILCPCTVRGIVSLGDYRQLLSRNNYDYDRKTHLDHYLSNTTILFRRVSLRHIAEQILQY